MIHQSERLGIVNIVFTGGEPPLRKGLPELVAAVDRDEANPIMFSDDQIPDDAQLPYPVERVQCRNTRVMSAT